MERERERNQAGNPGCRGAGAGARPLLHVLFPRASVPHARSRRSCGVRARAWEPRLPFDELTRRIEHSDHDAPVVKVDFVVEYRALRPWGMGSGAILAASRPIIGRIRRRLWSCTFEAYPRPIS